MIKVLIVDDEPLARENLRVLLQTRADPRLSRCANAVEAIGAVHRLRPTCCFWTFRCRASAARNGLRWIRNIAHTSCYMSCFDRFDEYAVKAFEEHAFDYLLKPIEENAGKTPARLQAVKNARRRRSRCSARPAGAEVYLVPHSRMICCKWNDVAFVSSR